MAINNKDYKPYGPFKLWTIENFPFIEADFDAITNYQLYSKIVEYMQKLCYNQTELQKSQTEVVNYVNNYFKDLDVQEEINNKLDEMAESGELEEIITSYLQVNGVLSYNTINEMKEAENIIEGSTCYTLGKITYNDGKGGFYKVRTITSGDTVDGFNIVALDISETLIAERIYKEINNIPNFFLYSYFDPHGSNQNGYNVHLFTSLNGKNVSRIHNNMLIEGYNRDNKVYFNEYDKKFYFVCTSGRGGVVAKITRTKDFINFDSKMIEISNIDDTYPVWSPNLYFENDDIYLCFTYGSVDDNTQQTYLSKCNDYDELTFDEAEQLTLTDPISTGYIDSQINKFSGYYYLLVKNETSKVNEIWRSSTIDGTYTIYNSNVINCNIPVEGGSLCFDGKYYHFNAQAYGTTNGFYITAKTTDLQHFDKLEIVNELYGYNNGNCIYLKDSRAKKIISELPNFNFNNYDEQLQTKTLVANTTIVEITSNINELTVVPNRIYAITGTGNFVIDKINNPFKLKKVDFVFRTGYTTSLTINKIINPLDITNVVTVSKVYNNYVSLNEKTITLDLYSPFNDTYKKRITIDNLISSSTAKFTIPSQLSVVDGNVLTVTVTFKATQNVNEYLVLGNLAGSRKPQTTILCNSAGGSSIIEIRNNGDIYGYVNLSTDGTVYITCTYVF